MLETTFNTLELLAFAFLALAAILRAVETGRRSKFAMRGYEPDKRSQFMPVLLVFFSAVTFLILALSAGNIRVFSDAAENIVAADPALIWLNGAFSLVGFFSFFAWLLQEWQESGRNHL